MMSTVGQFVMRNGTRITMKQRVASWRRWGAAGLAALALLGSGVAAMAAPAENLVGVYSINQNGFYGALYISGQNGNHFWGTMVFPSLPNDVPTPITGTVTGYRGSNGAPGPVSVVFERTLPNGIIQVHTGAAGRPPSGTSDHMYLAGTFSGNGMGPFPWMATR